MKKYLLTAFIVLSLVSTSWGQMAGNATRLQNRPLTQTAPTDGQVICWDATLKTWKPCVATAGAGDVVSTSANQTWGDGATVTHTFNASAGTDCTAAWGNNTATITCGTLNLAGTLALGANSLTMTGSVGATGARVLKGWFTDLEVTNAIAGAVTGNAGTATALAADPANCAAGQVALGVTAAGVAECTATPSLQAATLTGTASLSLGTAGSAVGQLLFKNATSGTLTVQPITGVLSATLVVGNTFTDAKWCSYATATGFTCTETSPGTPAAITVANEAADTATFVLFSTDATGDRQPKTNAGLTFNSSTGLLTATGFSGPINGTVGATTPTTGVFTTIQAASASSLQLGHTSAESSPAIGAAIFKNATNTNTFTIQSGTTGASIGWTLPTAVPAGENYLLTASTTGVLTYTAPTAFNPMTAQYDIIVGGALGVAARQAKGAANTLLCMNSSQVLTWCTSIQLDNSAAQFIDSVAPTKTIMIDPVSITAGVMASYRPVASGAAIFTNNTVGAGTYKYGLLEVAGTWSGQQTFVAPVLGAATGTSLLATGIVDGLTNVTIWTTGAITANPAGKMSHVIVNKHTTPATAFPVTLSTPIAGMQLIVKNGQGAGGANTGIITLTAGTNVIIFNPTTKVDCTATQNLVSGGAAADYVALVALDTTHWESVGAQGTWTCTTP